MQTNPTPKPGSLLLWCLMIFLMPQILCSAQDSASGEPKWEKETAAFVARQEQKPFAPGGIVFVGSSSIRLWNLEAAFPHHRTLNCGFGGSHIADSLNWFERLLAPFSPRLVVFYAGGNDLNSGKTPGTVSADARKLFERIHSAFPEARVAFISSAPNPKRWAQIENVRALNRMVKAMTEELPYLTFVDVHPVMLGEDGQPLPDIFKEDRLHMNEKGYAIWNKIVLPVLGVQDR